MSETAIEYRVFDQDEKLGAPPWSGPALEAWEAVHGHDVRLKCSPEFGCMVLERAQERRDAAKALRWARTIRRLEERLKAQERLQDVAASLLEHETGQAWGRLRTALEALEALP